MRRLQTHIFLGFDLGQRQDPAALVLLQRTHEPTGRLCPITRETEMELRFALIHAQRIPLRTPYLEIVSRLAHLIPTLNQRALKTLAVDASGVGAPVVELLKDARLQANIYPITISASGHPHSSPHGGYIVPRRDLITNLRVLFERRLLDLPAARHCRPQLTEELLNLRDRPTSSPDDLAIATALAAWPATTSIPHFFPNP
ncbi:MAG: hypothetical protein HY858_00690 [Candidatus Solibacter usitatus]|nr:hypothetical protein [Candidatus Solibacter usitatus]